MCISSIFSPPFPFAVAAVRGTVCQDRLNKVATKEEKELEKKAVPRGTADVLYQADQVLVVRKDNKAVLHGLKL
jgi:hypothetical protein